MFTQEELNNLQILLQRVDVKGNEAFVYVQLVQKIASLITPKEEEVEEKPKKSK
jgi:hypothetical protein